MNELTDALKTAENNLEQALANANYWRGVADGLKHAIKIQQTAIFEDGNRDSGSSDDTEDNEANNGAAAT